MISASARRTVADSIESLEPRIAPAAVATFDLSALNGSNGFKIVGEAAGDSSGYSVSGAGDINGDGFADVIIGAPNADPNGDASGSAYVVFGKAGGFTSPIDLAQLNGVNGFKIPGAASPDFTGRRVSGAGDVNGDGYDDLIIGASGASPNGSYSGASYVIYGKAAGFTPTFNVTTLNGSNGFKIQGVAMYDLSGISVGGAGDINGDGFDDVIIGATRTPNSSFVGASYVVFGKAASFGPTFNLSTLNGTNGIKIPGEAGGGFNGISVSGAGDVNGDHFDDLIVGATDAAYVVFGKASWSATPTVDLSSLGGTKGFKLNGEANSDGFGLSVSGAGDVNADGFADVIIGAPNGEYNQNGQGRGASYVIFGKASGFTSSLNVSTLTGVNGFKILGGLQDAHSGSSVSDAGDINGDGFDDVIVGAPGSEFSFQFPRPGASYVIYGKADGYSTPLNLSTVNGINGYRILGGAEFDASGNSVSGAGDVNGDGLADVIIGATGAPMGASFVVFGSPVTRGITADGHTATFNDADGDLATVKVSKGTLTIQSFQFRGTDGGLIGLNLRDAAFAGANVTISATKVSGGTGDGRIDVGFIDASGIDLGAVSVSGDLGKILAGNRDLTTAGVKTLHVGSLGVRPGNESPATLDPLHSVISGALGSFSAKTDVAGFLEVTGGPTSGLGSVTIGHNLDGSAGGTHAGLIQAGPAIGTVIVKGSIIGGADFSGIIARGGLGKVSIGGALTSANAAKPVTIAALGKLGATTAAEAVAIAGLSVKTDVLNARILAGYDIRLRAVNPDASIGPISVGGNWSAGSVVAGVKDTSIAGNLASAPDGFGRHDTLISGDLTPTLLATIASITIKGVATGTVSAADSYGITAQKVGRVSIFGALIVPTGSDTVLPGNGDFHLVTL